jgi:hypothetical protein
VPEITIDRRRLIPPITAERLLFPRAIDEDEQPCATSGLKLAALLVPDT